MAEARCRSEIVPGTGRKTLEGSGLELGFREGDSREEVEIGMGAMGLGCRGGKHRAGAQ